MGKYYKTFKEWNYYSIEYQFQIEIIALTANRSVYAIAFPHCDNFLAKEDRLVSGGTACPGSRRGLPPGVTVFANARNL